MGRGGRAARAAGGDACTGGCTDDQRHYQLLCSRRQRRWRRGAHARCSSAWCWIRYGKVRYPGEKKTLLGETLTSLFLQGLVLGGELGPTQESRRQVHPHVREREKERASEREREGARERETEREGARERERESGRERGREGERDLLLAAGS